jgi:hypothetical protein
MPKKSLTKQISQKLPKSKEHIHCVPFENGSGYNDGNGKQSIRHKKENSNGIKNHPRQD